jgi:hypothetical protein
MIILYRTLLLAPVYGSGPQIMAPYKANVIECIRCLCRNVGDVIYVGSHLDVHSKSRAPGHWRSPRN